MDKDIDVKEIQKDINDFLSKRYGKRVRFTGFDPLQQQAGNKSGEDAKEEQKTESLFINFDMKPEELKSYLDEYIVKQDEAKEVLATKICTHFNRIKMFDLKHKKRRHESMGEIKNNIIMLGPTGVGKTFLVKLIAKKIGVPFVKGDATKFSEIGYVGGDVEDLVRDLVHEANGNIELAQYGIIYLDEVDKIAASPTISGPDVSRSGVQRALLKPMEETEVELKVPHDPVSQMEAIMEFQKTGKREKKKINSKNILFIMSGSFSGLEEIIKNRLNRQGIGFGAEIKCKDEHSQYMKKLKAEDLIQYGFESEFIGRLPVITVFEQLEVEDLYNILRSPTSSIIIGKKRDFKAYGIDLQFEDEALRHIAENAFKERTGARGLNRALERVLIKFEHTLPSTNIRHLVITNAMVDDPVGELQKLLQNPEDSNQEVLFNHLLVEEERELEKSLRKKEVEFQQRYGIKFSDRRIKIITKRIVEERLELDSIVEELLAVYKEARDFEQTFTFRNNIKLSFNEEAIDCLVEKVWEEGVDLNIYLKRSFQNYEHGLKLINEKTRKHEFSIPPDGVENPEEYLNDLIRETYR
jgi:endopeptidase Clp ATP-binding regulatory subunit ClpX